MSGSARKVVIVDYGLGNLHSIQKAVKKIEGDFIMDTDGTAIPEASHVFLPGVGAFARGMKLLKERGQANALVQYAKEGKPLMGICLGAQFLLGQSCEFEKTEGLGIIPGKVQRIESETLPVPNVGWHQIRSANQDTWDNGILANSVESEWMYFVHSYHAKPDSDDNVLSYIDYDMGKITAAVRQGNCYGLQFHPEKSGSKGLSIIEEFLKL